MKNFLIIALAIVIGCDASENSQTTVGEFQTLVDQKNPWYESAVQHIQQQRLIANSIQNEEGAAKNIILFIGDGMNLTTVTASRILEGQQQGMLGEENDLSFDRFPFSGFAKTYAVDSQVVPVTKAPDLTLSIKTLTSLFSGMYGAQTLANWGLLHGEPDAIAKANTLFATRHKPHCPDHY